MDQARWRLAGRVNARFVAERPLLWLSEIMLKVQKGREEMKEVEVGR